MAEPLDISMIEAPPQLDPDPTASFSTTESIPSETYRAMADKPEPVRPQSGSHKPEESSTSTTEMPTAYLPTVTAYDAWAPIYDTDGNVLQKVDDLELERMLPEFVSEALGSQKTDGAMRILDLGCGTGRNTLKLVTYLWPEDMRVEITGIDASRGMLEIAKTKLHAVIESLNRRKNIPTFTLIQHDFLDPTDPTNPPIMPSTSTVTRFDAILTTLVLEHLPVSTFFAVLDKLIHPSGTVLLTNMHSEMGSRSQAGFVKVNEEGRQVKVRGRSWVHGVEETVDEARRWGFEVIGGVGEKEVSEDMLEGLAERAKKWVGTRVWYGMVLRKHQ